MPKNKDLFEINLDKPNPEIKKINMKHKRRKNLFKSIKPLVFNKRQSKSVHSQKSKSANKKTEIVGMRRSRRPPKLNPVDKKDYTYISRCFEVKKKKVNRKLSISKINRKINLKNKNLNEKKEIKQNENAVKEVRKKFKILKAKRYRTKSDFYKSNFLIDITPNDIIISKHALTFDPLLKKKKHAVLPQNEEVVNSYLKYQDYFKQACNQIPNFLTEIEKKVEVDNLITNNISMEKKEEPSTNDIGVIGKSENILEIGETDKKNIENFMELVSFTNTKNLLSIISNTTGSCSNISDSRIINEILDHSVNKNKNDNKKDKNSKNSFKSTKGKKSKNRLFSIIKTPHNSNQENYETKKKLTGIVFLKKKLK